jgi:hypothetical protein
VRIVQRVLVLEEEVVHRPEVILALGSGALGRLGGMSSMGVFRPWKVPVHEAEPVAESLANVLEVGVGSATERALEITVLHQGHGRVGWTQGMVPLGDGNCQAGYV